MHNRHSNEYNKYASITNKRTKENNGALNTSVCNNYLSFKAEDSIVSQIELVLYHSRQQLVTPIIAMEMVREVSKCRPHRGVAVGVVGLIEGELSAPENGLKAVTMVEIR